MKNLFNNYILRLENLSVIRLPKLTITYARATHPSEYFVKKSSTSGSLGAYSLEWVKYFDLKNYTAANSNHS